MELLWEDRAWNDYLYWQSTDLKILKRINELIKDIKRNPFSGIGKLEKLKGNLSLYWSRRITDEHRIVYSVISKTIRIIFCRYHYDK